MPRARLSRSVSGAVAVDPAELGGDATSPATPTRSRATRDLHPGAARISREDLVDALTCPVSGKLFVDPVTTVCGHSFSRRCLSTWMARTDRAPSCPTCRAPLYHENPRRWPVNTTLVDLVERFLGDELADALASEPGDGVDVRDGRGPGAGPAESELSLFVLDAITPGQEITLNVFEERYKLMVRRCLQGSRRFGMVGLIRDENDARRDDEAGDDEAYSSGDDSPRRNPTDGSDDDDDMTERARSSEISPPRAGGSDASSALRRPRRSRVRSSPRRSVRSARSVRRVGAECEIVAHQELVDGRLLVRCRAKRHVRLLDAREDPGGAGYLVARVEPVVDDEGEARDERIRATREFAATRVPPDASAPDASRTSTPLTARVAARAGLQRDSIGPRVADQRDWATTALLGERATAMHQTWLARVAGRPAAPGFSGAASSRSASLFRPNFLRRSYRDDVDNLLGWCGARPRADRLDDLSWWLTRVANPHPPIGAAVELRGECLAATSAKARFRVIHEKLVESMREVHRMRPSQWRGARPLASVNVAMATLRALEGRDGWRAAARECAFGDGEGYRDGDRNDRGVPRGNDYARVLEETLGALQKHAPTSLLLSDASDAASGGAPALSRPHVYPATPRTGGGRCPRGPIGAPRPFRSTPLVSKPRGTILPSRVTRKRRRDCFSGRSSEARSRGCVGRCTSRSNASTTTRAKNSSIDWATRSVSPARKNSPTSFLDGATPRSRFARSVGTETRPEASARGTSSFDPPPSSPIVSPPRVSGRCSGCWRRWRRPSYSCYCPSGWARRRWSVARRRRSPRARSSPRRRWRSSACSASRDGRERRVSGRVRGRVARSKDRWRAESDGSRLRGV